MNRLIDIARLRASLLFSFVICIIITSSCKESKDTYYYSGNKRIDIIIISDTLGVLLKDTILNPATPRNSYFEDVKKAADSGFLSLNYTKAGNLERDQFIQLLINHNKKKTRRSLENQARAIKSASMNRNFVSNAGYLVRIKGSNKAMILTDEIIIKFKNNVKPAEITQLFQSKNLSVVRKSQFDSLEYTVATTKDSPADALKISHQLRNNPIIEYAQINFIYVKRLHSTRPNDPLFDDQWTLTNTGSNGVDDADVDGDIAWDITMGSGSTILAIIDYGVDVDHYDLAANLLPGWNFNGNNNNLTDQLGHGNAVTGIANAVGNNNLGIIGICPQCKTLPIRSGHAFDQDAEAIRFAKDRGAKIINCSWDYGGIPVPPNVTTALKLATEAKITVVFSVANEEMNYCERIPELLDIPSLIFVSRSNSKDTYDNGGWGSCLSLVAPAGVWGTRPGYLKQLTTDVLSWAGYNDGTNDLLGCTPAYSNADFTSCFCGTSASAPLTAGTAGLILSENNSLTPMQVKYLLQDCADKIDPSNALYDKWSGKSTTAKLGFGRLNTYEAVKIVSPNNEKEGRNGIDIFLRDNELDWGNTEKPSTYSFDPGRGSLPCWKSMDIKVDAPDAGAFAPALNSTAFDNLIDEDPIGGKTNKVYVRVRNRGFKTAGSVTVKLYWVHAGAGLPLLPADFWDRFPADATAPSEWNSLGTQSITNLEYCGASVAHSGADVAQIVSFDFPAPVHDPSTRNHYCLMALISSPDDPIPTKELKLNPNRLIMDYVTSNYNNATHRNYNMVTSTTSFSAEFFMYNPLTEATFSKLEVSFKGQKIPVSLPDSIQGKMVYLKKNEKKLIKLHIDPTGLKEPTEVIIQQFVPGNKKEEFRIIGGINYFIVPDSTKSSSPKSKK